MPELIHLAIIWSGALAAATVARMTRLTPVVYYLGVGALFVNLGWLPPESDGFIRGLSELGIILIMFALGFEEKAINFVRSIKRSWGIAFFGALAPFLVASGVAYYAWGSAEIALMCGLAMTATSVSLSMVALRSEGLQNSEVATRIMTSAVLDDVASLVLVALVVPLVTEEGTSVHIGRIGLIVAKSLLFFAIIFVIGGFVFPCNNTGWLKKIPIIGSGGLRHTMASGGGDHATLQTLLIALISALIGSALGFHPAVGAYLAGLIIAEEYFSPGDERGSFGDTKRILDSAAFSWIGPVFFVNLGTRLQFDMQLFISVIPQVAAMTVGLLVFQVASAGLAARYTGGMKRAASLMIGFGMLGRAELAFVVMDIAYVQHSILSEEAFFTLMITCFWLNIAVPIAIHWWRPAYARELAAEEPRSPSPTV